MELPHDLSKDAGDVLAGTITIGVLAQWLPSIAAAFTIIWTGIRIYEWAERRFKFGRQRN